VDAALGMSVTPHVVVVAPAEQLEEARSLVPDSVIIVAGGATRQLSVAAGLGELAGLPDVDVVLVHDAARAFTPSSLFDAVEAAVRSIGAGAVPGLPVTDTIKRSDASGTVLETVDRSPLRAVQTPQGFPRAELIAAYAAATEEHTDDAALFSAAGHDVTVIDGDALAFKITTPGDLERAAHLAGTAFPLTFTGIGVDVHAFVDA